MQLNKYVKYFLFTITIVLFILSIINCANILSTLIRTPHNVDQKEKSIKLKAFEYVEKALNSKTKAHNFTFKGLFDSPFRRLSGVTPRRTGRSKKIVRKELFLKGTLIKENALAIIEDENGKTYICKQGDRIHNRLIVSINEDKVTIHDEEGTTVLVVKDR